MEAIDRPHSSGLVLRRRFFMVSALAGGFTIQTLYRFGFAAYLNIPEGHRWPPVVAAGLMTLVLAVGAWGRERKMARIAKTAAISAVAFILSNALLAQIDALVQAQIFMSVSHVVSDVLMRIFYFFILTGEAWSSFFISMAVAALITTPAAPPSHTRR